jgi:hypothetical protein
MLYCGVTVLGHGGSGHHKWYDGMARHLLLAHGMHLYVEWKLMEAKIHKHLFSSFFVIFGDGYVTVVACGVPVWGFGGEGYFGLFYGRARHHLLAHKGYPCMEKEHVKAEVNKTCL